MWRIESRGAFLRAAFASGLMLVTQALPAALVSVDWETPGDRLLTRDTATGREWLDLTVTAGWSFRDVSDQLQPGGYLYGFRYAREADIDELQLAAGLPAGISAPNQPQFLPAIVSLVNLLGETYYSSALQTHSAIGMTQTPMPGIVGAVVTRSFHYHDPGTSGRFVVTSYSYQSSEHKPTGSFLLRPVPGPLAILLMASALVMLPVRKRLGTAKRAAANPCHTGLVLGT